MMKETQSEGTSLNRELSLIGTFSLSPGPTPSSAFTAKLYITPGSSSDDFGGGGGGAPWS